jgi:acetylornithine deacetylase/succinyl-diaminopimelate desuccinylase-like protein
VNLKFFFDGEEEAGSGHLDEILTANAALLRADLWVIGDGPVHQLRRPQILFGARGVFGTEVTVYGPSRALHSGHYGNWAPNPIALLAGLLTSMRDEDGRILITGYGDDVTPIGPTERAAIAAAPRLDSALRAELLLGGTEADNALLGERIMLPAINFRGFRAGNVGSLANNAIPTEARASIDFRLVPRQTTSRVIELVEAHAKARGFHVVRDEPTAAERTSHRRVVRFEWSDGYPAAVTPMSHPAAIAAARAADMAVGNAIIKVPLMGGSLPLNSIEEVLRTPFVVLPIVNHDNNQHATNENLRLQNLWDGIEIYAGFLVALGTVWTRPIP